MTDHAFGVVEHDSIVRHDGAAPDKHPMSIAITVSLAEQDYQAELRHRSYELAVERGHMRRN